MTMTKNIQEMTNEELVGVIRDDGASSDAAYSQLYQNLKPVILGECRMYLSKVATYDRDDFLQEGFILIWKTTSPGGFKGGSFRNYFASAARYRFRNIYRDYVLKNPICIAQSDGPRGCGYTISALVEDEWAERYRIRHREHCKKYYDRKCAEKKAAQEAERIAKGLPEPEPEREPTPEELEAKHEARNARMREYYHSHKTPESIEAHRKRGREYYRLHKDEINRKRREKKAAERAARKAAAAAGA